MQFDTVHLTVTQPHVGGAAELGRIPLFVSLSQGVNAALLQRILSMSGSPRGNNFLATRSSTRNLTF